MPQGQESQFCSLPSDSADTYSDRADFGKCGWYRWLMCRCPLHGFSFSVRVSKIFLSEVWGQDKLKKKKWNFFSLLVSIQLHVSWAYQNDQYGEGGKKVLAVNCISRRIIARDRPNSAFNRKSHREKNAGFSFFLSSSHSTTDLSWTARTKSLTSCLWGTPWFSSCSSTRWGGSWLLV